jgi:RNA methyltransferase, TrmH family
MISKNHLKFIKSLQIKKYRKLHSQFIIEGAKSVLELLQSDFKIRSIFLTDNFLNCCGDVLNNREIETFKVTEDDLVSAGTFSSNNSAIAIAEMKGNDFIEVDEDEFALMLDDIRDPGNLGTIIRIADWYGIKKIICSENTADFYNPKVISSTMGSFTRVDLFYADLEKYLSEAKAGNVYGAVLGGDDIHALPLKKGGLIVMGNESAGIDDSLYPYFTQKITIPRFGNAESLNVAVATGIICDNLIRG